MLVLVIKLNTVHLRQKKFFGPELFGSSQLHEGREKKREFRSSTLTTPNNIAVYKRNNLI